MSDDVDLRLQYAGTIGLLCECSVYVDEDLRESIERAVQDFCDRTGWRPRRILDRIEVLPPSTVALSLLQAEKTNANES